MDKKREEELIKQIKELAINSATISNCVHMVELGLATWEEAMMECVISLGNANKRVFDELVNLKQSSPQPMIFKLQNKATLAKGSEVGVRDDKWGVTYRLRYSDGSIEPGKRYKCYYSLKETLAYIEQEDGKTILFLELVKVVE